MHAEKLKVDLTLNQKYSGMLARNLPINRVLEFAFNALSLAELSEITGHTPSYMSAIKTGRRQPTQEMKESVYAWYRLVSETPVSADELHNYLPIYNSDDVRSAEKSMREYFDDVEKRTKDFKDELRQQLRAIRKTAPEPDEIANDDDVRQIKTVGVLEERNGYDIVTSDSGSQKYVRNRPEDWYDDDGELLNMNERMARKRQNK